MYKYQISPKLLHNIKKITEEILYFNLKHYSAVILVEHEHNAVMQSAHSSTSIEGNPLPLTEVKKIIKNRPKNLRQSEREVINYNDALLWLNRSLKGGSLRFNQKLILDAHKKTMLGLLSKLKIGKIRTEPVFVNDPLKGKTIYWPPDHKDIPKLFKELLQFVDQSKAKIDPLILAGLFHKQFVILHPFVDGNGRTVRLMTKALLAQLGINTFHLFSFENYYNRNVSQYFEQVGVRGDYYDLVKKVDFTPWLEYFTEGLLDELLRVKKQLETEVSSPQQRPTQDQLKILEYLRQYSFIQDADYAKITARAKATRALDFKKLILLGLIEKHGRGRATYYKLKK